MYRRNFARFPKRPINYIAVAIEETSFCTVIQIFVKEKLTSIFSGNSLRDAAGRTAATETHLSPGKIIIEDAARFTADA